VAYDVWKKREIPLAGKTRAIWGGKNEIPLAGQTRADGPRHKTRKKRKIKQQQQEEEEEEEEEEELSDNIRDFGMEGVLDLRLPRSSP